MPTADQVAKWADDFEEAYPEALAERLRWFHEKMEIGQDRLLRLVGLPPAEVKELDEGGCVDWSRVAEEYGEGAAWAEEMILQAVAFFNYNWEGLRDHIREPVRAEYRVGLPGGKSVPLAELTPAEQEKLLLARIAEGNERAVAALIVFLSPGVPRPRTRRSPR
jgi:hypothetical protein